LDAWGTGVETTLPRNIDPYGYNAKWGYYYDRDTALYPFEKSGPPVSRSADRD
jgi:hypothetical protein